MMRYHVDMSHDLTDGVISGWSEARPDLEVGTLQVTARLSRIGTLLANRQEEVFDRFTDAVRRSVADA